MVNKDLREIRVHGKTSFPINEYNIMVPHRNFYNEDGLLLECHWHSEWEFFTICEGLAYLYVNGEKFLLNPHDIILIPGNSIHMAYMQDNSPCTYQSIVFSMNIFGNIINEDIVYSKYIKPLCRNQVSAKIFPFNKSSNLSDDVYSLFNSLFTTLKDKPKFYEILTKSHLYKLLAYSLLSIDIYYEQPDAKAITSNAQGIINAINYMKENLEKEIQITQLAKTANMSEGHFRTLFKQMTSLSPIEYLMNLRLDKAALALIHTDDKISTIAMDAGFNNIGYFNRSFKGKYGCTPKQYRIEKQNQL